MSRVADPKAKIALLRAAEAVFAERGLVGAKVEQITKLAGLSKGAFYLHFESKDAAHRQVVESFLARCGSLIAAPDDYPSLPEEADALLDFALERDRRIFDFLWQNRAILRILATCQGDEAYLLEAFRADIDERSRAWVRHLKQAGHYRPDVDADLAAMLIGGAYNELSNRMLRCTEQPPLEEWLLFAQETFARGFGSADLVEAVERRNQRVSQTTAERPRRRASRTRHSERD